MGTKQFNLFFFTFIMAIGPALGLAGTFGVSMSSVASAIFGAALLAFTVTLFTYPNPED